MADLMVDPSRVREMAAALRRMSKKYGEDIKEVYTSAGKLNATWQGSTSESFLNKIGSFRPDLERMETNLNAWADALDAAGAEYQNLLASINSALNG